ncbi:MAG: hypothetical protein ACOYT7_01245 [Patescibacteria group bacterium]
MTNEITIDAETARRLLFILSLEGDVKGEEIEWALAIIHQIPGYEKVTIIKAAQDEALKRTLAGIAAEQISPTTPKELKALIEAAEERQAALAAAKEVGEKRAEEFVKAAEKAAKTKAQFKAAPEAAAPLPETALPPPEEKVSFSIKITPAALKAFQESTGKAAAMPFKLVTFFSPPKALIQTPQTTAALASAMTLVQISAKAEKLAGPERKHLLELVENLRRAEFSFYSQVQQQRTRVSVGEMIILMGPESGRPQGEIVALVRGATPEKGPSFIGSIGQQIFGGLAQRAVTKAASKAITSALTKAGISITTKAVGAGVGQAAIPIPGVGAIVGWLASKVLSPLIDKVFDFIRKNKWVLAAPFVLVGLIFGLPWLTVGGIALGGVLLARGVGSALSMAGRTAASIFTGLATLTIMSVALPFLVALIAIPVLVAIILFIINSGAYLVPPSVSQFAESPYIDIEKTPEPPGPFSNPPPNVSVTYTIIIKAKKGTLTNIRFQYECRVVGSGGGNDCPPVEIPEAPLQISPTEPFSLSYSASYGTSFRDSIVVDTFTVVADAPDQAGATAATSASVVIGNPPIDCPLPAYDTKGKRWASYTPGDEARGHGSNAYWQGGKACRYSLPQSIGCNGPSDSRASSNVCFDESSRCAQYGYAYDVWPTGGTQVFAPRVGKESVVWNCSHAFANGDPPGSAGQTYACDSGPYHLVLTHLKEGARTGRVPSGQRIGELHPLSGNAHVHMEFSLNGVYQRPEDFFCF